MPRSSGRSKAGAGAPSTIIKPNSDCLPSLGPDLAARPADPPRERSGRGRAPRPSWVGGEHLATRKGTAGATASARSRFQAPPPRWKPGWRLTAGAALVLALAVPAVTLAGLDLRLRQGPLAANLLIGKIETAINQQAAPLRVSVGGAQLRYDPSNDNSFGVLLSQVEVEQRRWCKARTCPKRGCRSRLDQLAHRFGGAYRAVAAGPGDRGALCGRARPGRQDGQRRHTVAAWHDGWAEAGEPSTTEHRMVGHGG